MTRQHRRRLSAGLPAIALALGVLFPSACGQSQPDVALAGGAEPVPTTAGASVAATAAPTPPAPVTDQKWQLQFTIDLVEPDIFSFGGYGELYFRIDGSEVLATGEVSIGDATYHERAFDCVLDGDLLTLVTTEFTVEPVFGDDVGTETVTLELPPFPLKGDTVQATGSVVITTKPWAPTKSGTFTIILSKTTE